MTIEISGGGDVVVVRSTAASVTVHSSSDEIDVSSAVVAGGIPYTGSYEITPSVEEQVIGTTSRVFDRDIVVNPIPSNYGLITYDGVSITVS